jgi:transcriptional regulator with XRE-family HTH domain
MDQIPLRLERPAEIDLESVRRQPSMTRSIVLAADLAGFRNDKDLARKLGMDPATWARIKSGEGHFPQDKYELLFDEFGNEVPLIWLADRRGYVLTPKESELERRLRLERERGEKLEAENRLLRDLVQGRAR